MPVTSTKDADSGRPTKVPSSERRATSRGRSPWWPQHAQTVDWRVIGQAQPRACGQGPSAARLCDLGPPLRERQPPWPHQLYLGLIPAPSLCSLPLLPLHAPTPWHTTKASIQTGCPCTPSPSRCGCCPRVAPLPPIQPANPDRLLRSSRRISPPRALCEPRRRAPTTTSRRRLLPGRTSAQTTATAEETEATTPGLRRARTTTPATTAAPTARATTRTATTLATTDMALPRRRITATGPHHRYVGVHTRRRLCAPFATTVARRKPTPNPL